MFITFDDCINFHKSKQSNSIKIHENCHFIFTRLDDKVKVFDKTNKITFYLPLSKFNKLPKSKLSLDDDNNYQMYGKYVLKRTISIIPTDEPLSPSNMVIGGKYKTHYGIAYYLGKHKINHHVSNLFYNNGYKVYENRELLELIGYDFEQTTEYTENYYLNNKLSNYNDIRFNRHFVYRYKDNNYEVHLNYEYFEGDNVILVESEKQFNDNRHRLYVSMTCRMIKSIIDHRVFVDTLMYMSLKAEEVRMNEEALYSIINQLNYDYEINKFTNKGRVGITLGLRCRAFKFKVNTKMYKEFIDDLHKIGVYDTLSR